MTKIAEAHGYKPVVYKIGDKYYAAVNSPADSVQRDYDLQILKNYFDSGVSIKNLLEICPNTKLSADEKYYLCFD